jgi:hypothetical protein
MMPIRAFAAASLLAGLLGAVAAPASAQIYIGPGGPGFGAPPPPPYYGGPGYRPGFGGSGFGRISCGEGAQIVAANGFRRISPRECDGRVYRYTAFRGPASFEVRVSSSTGEITRVRRIN